MATDKLTPAQRRFAVANLLEWMRLNVPAAYVGLAQRFLPQQAQPPVGVGDIGDFFDTLKSGASTVVTAATNFVSSSGFQQLVDKALPFLASKQEQAALQQQAKLAQSGFTTINQQTGAPQVVPISTVVPPTAVLPTQIQQQQISPDWSKWALGIGAALGLGLFLTRRRN